MQPFALRSALCTHVPTWGPDAAAGGYIRHRYAWRPQGSMCGPLDTRLPALLSGALKMRLPASDTSQDTDLYEQVQGAPLPHNGLRPPFRWLHQPRTRVFAPIGRSRAPARPPRLKRAPIHRQLSPLVWHTQPLAGRAGRAGRGPEPKQARAGKRPVLAGHAQVLRRGRRQWRQPGQGGAQARLAVADPRPRLAGRAVRARHRARGRGQRRVCRRQLPHRHPALPQAQREDGVVQAVRGVPGSIGLRAALRNAVSSLDAVGASSF